MLDTERLKLAAELRLQIPVLGLIIAEAVAAAHLRAPSHDVPGFRGETLEAVDLA